MDDGACYDLNGCSLSEVRMEIERLWNSTEVRAARRDRLLERGESPEELDSIAPEDALSLRQTGAGILPEAIAIAVFFAPALNEIASQVARDVWAEFILPRIRQRFGVKSITERDSP